MESVEELSVLLNDDSVETRYAAFRALRNSAPDDPLIRGEKMAGRFFMHQVGSEGPPLVHISKQDRSEIVLFGDSIPLTSPVILFGGERITVRDTVDGRMKVKRLSDGEDQDQQMVVDATLPEVLRAVSELGARYTDIVDIIGQAKRNGCLDCRVAYSALPKDGRTFDRSENFTVEDSGDSPVPAMVSGSGVESGLSTPGFATDAATPTFAPEYQPPAPIIDSAGPVSRRDLREPQGLGQVSLATFNGSAAASTNRVSETIPPTGDIEIIGADELSDGLLLDDNVQLPTGTSLDMTESATAIRSL